MGQPVIQLQNEGNVNCVLKELRLHYQILQCLGEKEHNDNLAKVLLFMVELDVYNCRWSNGYQRVREFMEIEGGGRHSRHDDFHGGVR
ncbi:hypothetical protein VC83_00598 [Pseudogymnoascus destructans]|uniref:Uncharacterized protein n=1 Tax=Pseudogymnoascus destructans TaxID=655981 RepID=A0A177AM27_9PEZI|nr:uncharacterized protein VC83_00598 [Pseudogymnoascus destructans]OAF63085.1 hypothetical protein VC83_00598 [Pseudogymnoascus destructans]